MKNPLSVGTLLKYKDVLRKYSGSSQIIESINKVIFEDQFRPAYIDQYREYELFLDQTYSLEQAKNFYLNSLNLIDSPLEHIQKLEYNIEQTVDVKRVTYDALVDGTIKRLSGVKKNIFNHIPSNSVSQMGDIMKPNEKYVGIIVNLLGKKMIKINNEIKLLPTHTESHFQLIYSLCRSIIVAGAKPIITVVGLPFSGFGWPQGDFDTSTLDNDYTFLDSLFADILDSVKVNPIIRYIRHDKGASWIQNAQSAYSYLCNQSAQDWICEIELSCISGTFLSYLPRYKANKRIMLAACSNNRLHLTSSEISKVICNNPRNVISNKSVIDKFIPYTPVVKKSDALNLEKEKLDRISNSRHSYAILCSNYLHVSFTKIFENPNIYTQNSPLRLITIGNISSSASEFKMIETSCSEIISLNFQYNLPALFQLLKSLNPFIYTMVPYGITGMATSILLSSSYGIPFLASSINDARSFYDNPSFFTQTIEQFSDRLEFFKRGGENSGNYHNLGALQHESFQRQQNKLQKLFEENILR